MTFRAIIHGKSLFKRTLKDFRLGGPGNQPLRRLFWWLSATPVGALLALTPVVLLAEWFSAWQLQGGLQVSGFTAFLVHVSSDLAIIVPLVYVLFVVPMARHLRHRAAFEHELRLSRDELEIRVMERTVELRESHRQLQHEMQERLDAQQAVQFQASLLDTVEEAVIATDSMGRILHWNQFAEKLYGWQATEAQGRNIAEMVVLVQADGNRMNFTDCREKTSWTGSFEAVRRDQSRLPVYIVCSRLNSPPAGHVLVTIDISELKRLETELRDLSIRLLLVQEEERKRVARDLHDSIGQTLSSIKFIVEATVGAPWPNERRAEMKRLRDLVPIIQSAIEELRQISSALRPPTLDSLGLVSTIVWHLRELGRIRPRLIIEQQLRAAEAEIPADLKAPIYRILQEATNNALKHSGALHLSVGLVVEENRLRFWVEDDGDGFDPQALKHLEGHGGSGLSSMRERTMLTGGTFTLASAPGMGTTVNATWRLTGTSGSNGD